MTASAKCAFCGCPRSQHCKGGVDHFHSKGNFEQVIHCVGQHCNNPLCCCVGFIEPDSEIQPKTEGEG